VISRELHIIGQVVVVVVDLPMLSEAIHHVHGEVVMVETVEEVGGLQV
jgi:hypothetical protein